MIDLATPCIGRQITSYTVPLIYKSKGRGTGVLVKTGKIHGILTASHVVHGNGGISFNESNPQLLQMSLSLKPNSFGIPIQYLTEIPIGVPENKNYGALGPDLTFIRIPRIYVGDIEARKSFLNLDKIYTEDWSYSLDAPCVISGYPEAYHDTVQIRQGTGVCLQELQLYGFLNSENYTEIDELDFMSVTIRRDQNPKLPKQFNGISGGPVWTFDFYMKNDGTKACDNLRLVGVAYYQDPEIDQVRDIRCHFVKSIYKSIEKIYNVSQVDFKKGELTTQA